MNLFIVNPISVSSLELRFQSGKVLLEKINIYIKHCFTPILNPFYNRKTKYRPPSCCSLDDILWWCSIYEVIFWSIASNYLDTLAKPYSSPFPTFPPPPHPHPPHPNQNIPGFHKTHTLLLKFAMLKADLNFRLYLGLWQNDGWGALGAEWGMSKSISSPIICCTYV